MTTAVAAVNVTFDSTDCTDLTGIFLFRIVRGGPGTIPTVDGTDQPLPGADGLFVRPRRIRRRPIELFGWVRGVASTEATDRDDYWNNRSALEALFDPTDVAVLRIDTGSAAYSIDALPLSVEFNELVPSFAEVSIVLESVEPNWSEGT